MLYRPFTKLWLYEDHRILSSVKTVSAMFPRADAPPPPRSPHQHTVNINNIRSSRDQDDLRSQGNRHRSRLPGHPAEAMTMAGPSNMAIFGVLSSNLLPDLHLIGPGQQTRALPRQTQQ